MKQAEPAVPYRKGTKDYKHYVWRHKRQDIMVVFTGTVSSRVRSTAKRVAGSADRFGAVARGRPERREDLPPGHPPIDGLEHVNPTIMTIMLDGSMSQVVELLESHMPMGMVVVPIPSERCNVW